MTTMHPGEILKECMEDMTQADLAKRIGVDNSTVSRLIRGDSDMTAIMAVKLEDVFSCSAEEWLTWQAEYSIQQARKALKNAVA